MRGNSIAPVIVFLLILLVRSHGLRCWHCIAEDCDSDPSENYKATDKSCNPGQYCQKVYFEMVEETDKGNLMHTSTVRGCSTECLDRNDFLNCTEQLRTSRGCARKDCCDDKDLCNGAVKVVIEPIIYLVSTVIVIMCLLY